MSFTIEMEDERFDSFILIFKDRSALDAWKGQIQSLVTSNQNQPLPPQPPIDQGLDMDDLVGSAKAARMVSGCTTPTTPSIVDSLLQGSARSAVSSSTSQASIAQVRVTPHASAGPSNFLAPLPHPALDLILIISLPLPSPPRSTAQLNVRVIKASLDFILASLGNKDRFSLVTFKVGHGGRVCKTPYLCVGKALSRGRLSKFIDKLHVWTKGKKTNSWSGLPRGK